MSIHLVAMFIIGIYIINGKVLLSNRNLYPWFLCFLDRYRLFLPGYRTVTYQHRHWLFLPTASWCWCGVAMATWCRCVTSRETSEQQSFHWDALSAFPSLLCVLLLSITSQPLFFFFFFSGKRSSADKAGQKRQRRRTSHTDAFYIWCQPKSSF